jgi:pimeloyl-ACP methyl ester carboxylesterase
LSGAPLASSQQQQHLPPVSPSPQRVCGACFDRHANVDASRDHDAFGPPEPPTLSCTRPPVVLLPPQLAGRAALQPLAEALAALHFRAETVDLPGMGSRWREELTPQGALEAVDAAVRRGLARGHGRVLLAGHGMGGFLAARYAALRPEGLLGVVATGCSYRADTAAARLARAAEGAALALAGERDGGAQRAARRQLLPAEDEQQRDDEARALERCLLRGAGAERRAWRGCAAVLRECGDMPAQLRACREGRIPVLLSSRGGGGARAGSGRKRKSGGSGGGSAAAPPPPPKMTPDERACLEALGPYGHRFSSSAGARIPDGRRGGGAGATGAADAAAAFPFSAPRAAAWAAAVAAFCDERI